jgi:hypothetical protein
VPKEIRATFDDIRFRVQFEGERQVACVPICPNCAEELERHEVAGDSMLICPNRDQGCTAPVKRFGTVKEMEEFLNTACREIAKRRSS